jgi:hypothetical protein
VCDDRAVVDERERQAMLAMIRKLCLALPEAGERPSHGAPTFQAARSGGGATPTP